MLPRRLLRAGRRGLRHGAVRGVPVGEAGPDDDGCGRPARRRARPADGAGRRAERGRRRARVRVAARARRRGEDARPRGPRARARGDVGRVRRPPARRRRVKVAYFSPLPPDTSGIADYAALLLPALERLVEVEVVRPGRTRPVADADVALYHVGNNPDAHGWIVDALRRRPGVVVLHEFVLHHLVAGLTIGRKDGHAYLAALEREAGVPGRLLGYGVLEGRVPPLWEVRPEEFPLAGEVLDRATGLIVHSGYVEARAREHGYDGPLWRIPHPAWAPPAVATAVIAGAPLIGCFGHLNESKRIPQLLRAFAALRRTHPGARLLLVGSEAPGFDLAGRLERLGIEADGVVREPYVEEERLWALMAACDACVLLRAPTMGETSGSAIRALSLGKPLVVSDVGWFAELPDEVALKAPVGGDAEVEGIAAALERLAEPGVAAAMGERARAYVEREHGLERSAALYVAALEQAAGDATVRARGLREVAEAAADVGLEPELLAPALGEASLLSADGRVVPGHGPGPGPGPWPLRTLPMWAWLGALYAVAVAVQLALALRVSSPWIMVDELVYSDMARSFASTGHFLIRGVHANYGFVYPLLLSPVYAALGPMADVYRWARVVDALVMCSVVLPVYLLARRVVRPPAALAAAALAVAVPSLAYTGTLMTENVFYPVFAWVVLALVLALERPTLRRQVVVLALCALAFLTRAQAVALVAAVLTAPLALAWIERGRPRRFGAYKPLYGAVALAALLAVVVEAARGRSPAQVLGNYSVTSNGGYHVWPAFRWLVLHVAELDLYLWVVPFAAMIVLLANARHLDRGLRAFAAAAAVVVPRRRLGRPRQRRGRRAPRRRRSRRRVSLAPAPLRARAAGARRARLPHDVAAARALAAQLPSPLSQRLCPGGRREQELDRPGRRAGRARRRAVVGRERARGVGERVLEPQRRSRLRAGDEASRRHAGKGRRGRPPLGHPARRARATDPGAVRARGPVAGAARDARRRRSRQAARALPVE